MLKDFKLSSPNKLTETNTCYSFFSDVHIVRFSLHINNFVIIGAIINLISIRSVGPGAVPSKINRPGAWNPLSHFIVISNWCVWSFWISHPVHDQMIIGGIVNTKRPWFSPSIVDTVSSLVILGLDEGDTWERSP